MGFPLTILGDGSNVLISDAGIRGVVVQTGGLSRLTLHSDGRINVGAGVRLYKVTRAARKAGLSGIAFAYGIPGTIGGAIYMNAGAFEHDIGEICESVDVLQLSGKRLTRTHDEMAFGYRTSVVQAEGDIVLEATLQLTPDADPAQIWNEMHELSERRKRSQPLAYPSAGSAFKRPPGNYAAKLIDECGLRGFTLGNAQVSEKHTGFIINRGGARAAEVLQLIEYVRQRVHEHSGIWLEPEIRMLGFERGT